MTRGEGGQGSESNMGCDETNPLSGLKVEPLHWQAKAGFSQCHTVTGSSPDNLHMCPLQKAEGGEATRKEGN